MFRELDRHNPDGLFFAELRSSWTTATEKLLLYEVQTVDSAKKPIKQKWKKIASAINKKGYKFEAEECRLKHKSLKERYTRRQKSQKKSGTSGVPKNSVDEVMHEVFSNCPDVNPVFNIESGRTAPTDVPVSSGVESGDITMDSDTNGK